MTSFYFYMSWLKSYIISQIIWRKAAFGFSLNYFQVEVNLAQEAPSRTLWSAPIVIFAYCLLYCLPFFEIATSLTSPTDTWQTISPKIKGFIVIPPISPMSDKQIVDLPIISFNIAADTSWSASLYILDWMPCIDKFCKFSMTEKERPLLVYLGSKIFCSAALLKLNWLLRGYKLFILGCRVRAKEKDLISILIRDIFFFFFLVDSIIEESSVTSND